MKHIRHAAKIGALIVGNLLAIGLAPQAMASSHREAPFITRHPKVDATDFYMFRSYQAGRGDYTTLIANYAPLQDAYGGPNYFAMDPDALYEIHIDNNGDGKEDLTFQFRFNNTNKDTQLTVGGKKVSIPAGDQRRRHRQPQRRPAPTCAKPSPSPWCSGDRRAGTRLAVTNADGGGTTFDKPLDNIGNKSIPNYDAYAAKHVYNVNIPGCSTPARMFVGQRKDPFVVNLGETFDLINIKAPAVEFDAERRKRRQGRPGVQERHLPSRLEVPTACLLNATARRPRHRRLDHGQPAPGPPA